MKDKLICIFVCLIVIIITLILIFTKPLTVYFATNSNYKIDNLYVKKGDKIGKLETPKKDGYTFLYWTVDGEIINEDYIVNNNNLILVANYEKKNEEVKETFTVTFDTDGGSNIEIIRVQSGNKVSEPNNPEKEGYIFEKWNLNGQTYDFNSPVTNNITLKASYIKSNSTTYTVTFDTDGGSKINAKIVEENKVVAKPTNPIKSGYVFKEWQLNGKAYNFSTKVTSDITLKAIYEKANTIVNVSSVTLDKSNFTVDVGKTVTLKATISPSNATNKTVTWKSSDESIATVKDGVVTGKKPGTVTITAVVDGKSASSKITVSANLVEKYTYELVDVPGSTIGQCYIYIKNSAGSHVNGSLTVTYQNGKSETINVSSNGYLWPSKNTIKQITNVKGN